MTTSGAGESGRRRRRWSDEDKARIVAECDGPRSSVSLVARRHDLNANLLFSWRRQFRGRRRCAGEVSFVPAVIAPQEPAAGRPAAMPAEARSVLASADRLDSTGDGSRRGAGRGQAARQGDADGAERETGRHRMARKRRPIGAIRSLEVEPPLG